MTLAVFACDPASSRGRRHVEPVAPTRTEVQRDRDRVLHSSAFLRLGYQAEARRKEFTLVTLARGLRGRWGSLEGSGFALARDRDGQRWIDPGVGGRVAAETGFRAFTGDLGVRFRIEGAYVGSRETDIGSSIDDIFDEQVLPGYATSAASVAITLGDATMVVRADNLEDERRPQVWLDVLTGAPALGAGRQVRAELIWPFFN